MQSPRVLKFQKNISHILSATKDVITILTLEYVGLLTILCKCLVMTFSRKKQISLVRLRMFSLNLHKTRFLRP
jgi:hypothetical protein